MCHLDVEDIEKAVAEFLGWEREEMELWFQMSDTGTVEGLRVEREKCDR